MPFRIRKSVSAGGIRLNFGKHGFTGVSTGVRGFRVTTGKNGTRMTVGIPGTGISYTQRIDSPTSSTPTQPVSAVADQHTIQTADVTALSEVSSQEVLDIALAMMPDTISQRPGTDFSLRWILAYMIQEIARHNGHADILCELIDGRTGR